MLTLGLEYGFDILKVDRVTIGVFENNEPAYLLSLIHILSRMGERLFRRQDAGMTTRSIPMRCVLSRMHMTTDTVAYTHLDLIQQTLFDISDYVSGGMIDDLRDYLVASDKLSESMLVENVLDVCKMCIRDSYRGLSAYKSFIIL